MSEQKSIPIDEAFTQFSPEEQDINKLDQKPRIGLRYAALIAGTLLVGSSINGDPENPARRILDGVRDSASYVMDLLDGDEPAESNAGLIDSVEISGQPSVENNPI